MSDIFDELNKIEDIERRKGTLASVLMFAAIGQKIKEIEEGEDNG